MGKQPYIPLYVGDYLKDTRVLPLAVRGAWVDLILFMWDAPVRGELVGSIADFARLMSCDQSEAEFALNLLKQKSTADITLLPDGQTKIVSRKMRREAEISKKRSDAGKNGVEAKKEKEFAQAKAKAKREQNTDNDNEYDIEINNTDKELSKIEVFEKIFTDEVFLTDLSNVHKGKDVKQAFEECWIHFSQAPRPPEHIWQWKQKLGTWLTNMKKEKTNGEINGNIRHKISLREGFNERNGTKPNSGA